MSQLLLTKDYIIKRVVGSCEGGYLVCGIDETFSKYKQISFDEVLVVDTNIHYLENRREYFKKLNGAS